MVLGSKNEKLIFPSEPMICDWSNALFFINCITPTAGAEYTDSNSKFAITISSALYKCAWFLAIPLAFLPGQKHTPGNRIDGQPGRENVLHRIFQEIHAILVFGFSPTSSLYACQCKMILISLMSPIAF
jgi:hypothetical protein